MQCQGYKCHFSHNQSLVSRYIGSSIGVVHDAGTPLCDTSKPPFLVPLFHINDGEGQSHSIQRIDSSTNASSPMPPPLISSGLSQVELLNTISPMLANLLVKKKCVHTPQKKKPQLLGYG